MQNYPKGVRRIDDERSHTHGWSAIVTRVSGKASPTFCDNAHGGREAAYQKAVAWAEEHFKKYPVKKRIARITHLRRNNRSGISGVTRYPADEHDQRPGAYWAAKWVAKPNTLPKIRKFMIAKYGESQAKWLAIQADTKGVEVIVDIEFAEGPVQCAALISPLSLPRALPPRKATGNIHQTQCIDGKPAPHHLFRNCAHARPSLARP